MVYFVESSRQASESVRQNLRSLGISTGIRVLKLDVLAALRRLETESVAGDFFFLDPPYRMQKSYGEALEFLAQSRLLRATSIVIAEHEQRFDPGEVFGSLHRHRKLEQGDAALSFYRM